MSGIKINTTEVSAVYRNLCNNARLERTLDMILSMLDKRLETLKNRDCIGIAGLEETIKALRTRRRNCASAQSILAGLGIGKNMQTSVANLSRSGLAYLNTTRPIQKAINVSNAGFESLTEAARTLQSRLDALLHLSDDIDGLCDRINALRMAISASRSSAQTTIEKWKSIPGSERCLRDHDRRLTEITAGFDSIFPGKKPDADSAQSIVEKAAEKIRAAEIAHAAAVSHYDDTLRSLSLMQSIAAGARKDAPSVQAPSAPVKPAPEHNDALDTIARINSEAEALLKESDTSPDPILSGLFEQIQRVYSERLESPEYVCTTIRTYLDQMRDYSIKTFAWQKELRERVRGISARLSILLDGEIRPADELETRIRALLVRLDTLAGSDRLQAEEVDICETEASQLSARAEADEEQLYLQLTLIAKYDTLMLEQGYEPDDEAQMPCIQPDTIARLRYRISEHAWVVVHVSPSLKTSWYVEYEAPPGTTSVNDLSDEDHDELVDAMQDWEQSYHKMVQQLEEDGIHVQINRLDSQKIDEYTFIERQTTGERRRTSGHGSRLQRLKE